MTALVFWRSGWGYRMGPMDGQTLADQDIFSTDGPELERIRSAVRRFGSIETVPNFNDDRTTLAV